jgi:hypothetical protein
MHLQSYDSGNCIRFSVSQLAVLNCAIQKPVVQGKVSLQLIISVDEFIDFLAFYEYRKRKKEDEDKKEFF